MKVVLIYRQRRSGGYSIEELFHTTAEELRRKHVDVIEYEVGPRWQILFDVLRLRQLNADIYHIPGDINYFVTWLPRRKTVLTVHDIGNYLFGLAGLKRWLYKWVWLLFPIRHAAAVTSTSKATRNNIVQYLGFEEERIQVIDGSHSAIFKPVPKGFAAEPPVILQVGTGGYKNVDRLIEAIAGLRCRLVLIGSLNSETEGKLRDLQIDHVNHVGISHQEVYRQYVDCDLVSFVSTGEGFGVPILEAQAVGRPVITANIPPMSDVAGEGACLVNPLDVAQIRAGIERIVSDESYRSRLVERGFENVRRYSPVAISNEYLALYQRLAAI